MILSKKSGKIKLRRCEAVGGEVDVKKLVPAIGTPDIAGQQIRQLFTLAQKVGIALLKCKKTSSLQYNVHFPQSIICCFPKKIRGGSVPIDLRISVMIYPIHKREMVRQCTTSLND